MILDQGKVFLLLVQRQRRQLVRFLSEEFQGFYLLLLSFSQICWNCVRMLYIVWIPADMPLYDIL